MDIDFLLKTEYTTEQGDVIKLGDILEGTDIAKGIVKKTDEGKVVVDLVNDKYKDCWIPIEHYLRTEHKVKIIGTILSGG